MSDSGRGTVAEEAELQVKTALLMGMPVQSDDGQITRFKEDRVNPLVPIINDDKYLSQIVAETDKMVDTLAGIYHLPSEDEDARAAEARRLLDRSIHMGEVEGAKMARFAEQAQEAGYPVTLTPPSTIRHHSGNKYLRKIHPAVPNEGEPIFVDVYCVIKAFNVVGAGQQHALKKILCAGIRGKGDKAQDLQEAIDSLKRAIEQENEDGV